jgi:hypothetical protein
MKRLLISIAALALIVLPQFVLGSDLDDLKAADDRAQKLNYSLNPNDIEAYVNLFHKDLISINADEAFPSIATKEQMRRSKANSIASTESVSYNMIHADYHVEGNTGVVCHYGTEVKKPKDGPTVIRNLRHTITFVKTDGKWLVYAFHASAIPSGN